MSFPPIITKFFHTCHLSPMRRLFDEWRTMPCTLCFTWGLPPVVFSKGKESGVYWGAPSGSPRLADLWAEITCVPCATDLPPNRDTAFALRQDPASLQHRSFLFLHPAYGGCSVSGDTQGQAGWGFEHLVELWVHCRELEQTAFKGPFQRKPFCFSTLHFLNVCKNRALPQTLKSLGFLIGPKPSRPLLIRPWAKT